MEITLKKISSDYFSDYAREIGVYDHHDIEIYADDVKVGTLDFVDQLSEDNDTCYIERIDINEEYRGQGIGTEVLKNTLYSEYGFYSVVVAPDNDDAKRLYERIGTEYTSPMDDDECDFSYNDQGYGVYVI